jgi:hypothetical protein
MQTSIDHLLDISRKHSTTETVREVTALQEETGSAGENIQVDKPRRGTRTLSHNGMETWR